jgi:hypothetical protein
MPEEDDSGFADELATMPEPAAGEPASAGGELASEVSDPEPSPTAPDPAQNTLRVAWLLGSKLSLAALANDRGAEAGEVTKWLDQSRRLAEILGTTVSELPPRPASPEGAADAGIDYLFAEGQRIGRDLAVGHGDDHAAAFELAVKSNILLALYQPGAKVADALAAGMEAAGRRAGLPAEYFAPLQTVVGARGTPAELRDAVYEMYRQVDEQLSTAQP